MPLVPIDVPPGVVRRATPLQSAGRYWDANLIRWQSGKLLPVGGWQRITETPLTSTPRAIFPWNTNSGVSLTLIGCDDGIFSLEGSTYTDVTPDNFTPAEAADVGGYGAYDFGELLYGDDTDLTYPRPESAQFFPPFSWTIDNWGEDALAVASSDGRLLHYQESEATLHQVGVTDIITAIRASNIITVTTTDHHGFANGDSIVIAGVSVGSMDGTYVITSVPTETTFTYANSGSNTTGTGGTASTLIPVPENNRGVVVTTERYAVLFGSGGNARRVAWSNQEDYTNWDFANVTTTSGFLDLDTTDVIIMATSVREGILIWTSNEAWLMRYIGLPFIYSIDRIGFGCGLLAPKSFATTAGRCIWMGREGFWIYDGGVVKPLACDVGAYVFSNIDPDSGISVSHGSDNGIFPEAWFWYPSIDSSVPDRYVVYNYSEGWWSIGEMERSASVSAGIFKFPISGSVDGTLYFHEDGWTDAGVPITTARYAETASINVLGGNNISNVTQAVTDSGTTYDATQLTMYAAFTPQGAETVFGPYLARPDGYTDVRVSGRDFRVKIAATKDEEWSIGQIRLDVKPGGRR
jgi:hypothetical protein